MLRLGQPVKPRDRHGPTRIPRVVVERRNHPNSYRAPTNPCWWSWWSFPPSVPSPLSMSTSTSMKVMWFWRCLSQWPPQSWSGSRPLQSQGPWQYWFSDIVSKSWMLLHHRLGERLYVLPPMVTDHERMRRRHCPSVRPWRAVTVMWCDDNWYRWDDRLDSDLPIQCLVVPNSHRTFVHHGWVFSDLLYSCCLYLCCCRCRRWVRSFPQRERLWCPMERCELTGGKGPRNLCIFPLVTLYTLCLYIG